MIDDKILYKQKMLVEQQYAVGPKCSRRFIVWEDGHAEIFVTLTNGGLKAEGDEYPLLADAPHIAIQQWLESFHDYAEHLGEWLYWRCYPVLREIDGRWAVYSRLVVSNHSPAGLKWDDE